MLALLGSTLSEIYAAAPTFMLRNPTPHGTSLVGVAFANNRFVAVG